ncbi:MAG: hypothetical protein ACT4OE_05820 [Sphingosinicella sp.]
MLKNVAKNKVRVNHNVMTACIESGLPPLNVLAQDFVGKAPAELVDRLEIPRFSMERGPGFGLRRFNPGLAGKEMNANYAKHRF